MVMVEAAAWRVTSALQNDAGPLAAACDQEQREAKALADVVVSACTIPR